MVTPILPMAPMAIYAQDMTTPESRAEYYKACWQKAAEKVVRQNEVLKKYYAMHQEMGGRKMSDGGCMCKACAEAEKEIFE